MKSEIIKTTPERLNQSSARQFYFPSSSSTTVLELKIVKIVIWKAFPIRDA